MVCTDMDWQELQRECHPFPAYVDYIYERDIAQSAPEQQPQSAHGSYYTHDTRSAPALVPYAPVAIPTVGQPVLMYSTGQYLGDFQATQEHVVYHGYMGSPQPTAGFGPVVQPPPYLPQMEAPLPAAMLPTGIHILQPNELLQPHYDWMDGLDRPPRHLINDKVNSIWATMQSPSSPDELRKRQNMLTYISVQVSDKHTHQLKVETTKHNIHKELPRLWQALKMRSSVPPSHDLYRAAGQYLISMMGTLTADARKYAEGLVTRMVEADSQGRNALEIVPGYVAPPEYIAQDYIDAGFPPPGHTMPKRAAWKKVAARRAETPIERDSHGNERKDSAVFATAVPPWASSPPRVESSPLPQA